MIIVYHHKNKVVEVENDECVISFQQKNTAEVLFEAAEKFENHFIIWCHIDLKDSLSSESLLDIFHHRKIMASYNIGEKFFLNNALGYIEESVFLNVNKNVTYPTWMMSSWVGGLHASVLKALKNDFRKVRNFDYFLVSLGKLASVKGLLCYSEPQLLKNKRVSLIEYKDNFFVLFQFVKQHYKTRWSLVLFLNLILYERKIKLFPLLYGLFFKKREIRNNTLDTIEVSSSKKVVDAGTIDVIIPTIGRKQYLYDVLKDLTLQTHLPVNVIIIEQNPNLESVSELDYLFSESWPFIIKHTFTHQSGACNARNLALSQVESEWVFLNDDDNRFETSLIENALKNISIYGAECITTSYLQNNEIFKFKIIHQSGIFGSGNSFLKSKFLSAVKFNMALEFGYGEDVDFGLQLRNIGNDIIYFPELKITHLKAPMGGFRTKFVFPWENEGEFPKPSPTIMYVKQKYFSLEQISGYRTLLFVKTLKMKSLFKWFNFYTESKQKWNLSIKWSKKLL
ncbi:glycosyltransferase family A protein [Flavobacterium sp.]|uniref:glycosyltransferase family 2 protein n=1 Tax=Flavobacterium sp. TaxID=239 RepID=UPI0031E125C8